MAFPLALPRLGRKRGQKLVRLRPVKAIASLRKFDEHGDWHYVTMPFKIVFQLLTRRKRFHDFIDAYWYHPNR